MIGVVGGSGGVGASVFAAVLAATAAVLGGRALLIDLDVTGGGVDVTLGLESAVPATTRSACAPRPRRRLRFMSR